MYVMELIIIHPVIHSFIHYLVFQQFKPILGSRWVNEDAEYVLLFN